MEDRFKIVARFNVYCTKYWYYSDYHEAQLKIEQLIREHGLTSNDIDFYQAPFND